MSTKNEDQAKEGGRETINDKESNIETGHSPDPGPPLECWGARHTVTLMGFLGMTVAYSLRSMLSIAIVAMVRLDSKNLDCNLTKEDHSEVQEGEDGEFAWDEATQGLLLGCFHYGSLATNFLGGRLAEHVGGTKVAGTGVLVSSVIAILSPLCVRVSTGLFVAVRILQGAAIGVFLPAMNVLLASWMPSVEKAKLTTIVYNGIEFGIILSMVLGGWLCGTGVLGGWPLVFYVFGGLGLLWTLAWFLLVRDHPEVHSRISKAEKDYILVHCGVRKGEVMSIPWRSLVRSLPLWSVILVHFGHNWGSITFTAELPSYLKHIHHLDMKNNGLVSALPYLSMWIFSLVYSSIVNALLSRGKLSTLAVRRISTSIGTYGRILGLIVLCFVNSNKVLAIAAICVSVSLGGAVYSGFICSLQDLAPNLAGTLMGISFSTATIANFGAPQAIGFILKGHQTLAAWRTVFIMSAVVYMATGTMYALCITDEEQPWNNA